MDATKAARIKELDEIRLTVPLKGMGTDDKMYDLPVGSEGTVLMVFGEGAAFETEFGVWPYPEDPHRMVSIEIPVRADQCEPV